MAGRRDALGAGVRGDVSSAIDQRDLAYVRLRVTGQKGSQRLLGAVARAHVIESERPEADVHPRLRGHRANPGESPWHDWPDLEVVRLHRNTELAGRFVARDYRIRHASVW